MGGEKRGRWLFGKKKRRRERAGSLIRSFVSTDGNKKNDSRAPTHPLPPTMLTAGACARMRADGFDCGEAVVLKVRV
jgi:hypothetical protein